VVALAVSIFGAKKVSPWREAKTGFRFERVAQAGAMHSVAIPFEDDSGADWRVRSEEASPEPESV